MTEEIPDCPRCKEGYLFQFDIWDELGDVGWMWECDKCDARFSFHPDEAED